jgi:hypothetical protein
MERSRNLIDYLKAEFDIEFDPVELDPFPDAIDRELTDVSANSMAFVLNAQSLEIAKLRRRLDHSRLTGTTNLFCWRRKRKTRK